MRRMIKRITVFLIAVAMLFSTAGFSSAAEDFPDLPDGALRDAVLQLSEMGVIGGFPDGTYGPDEYLTRAQFAKIAICLLDAVALSEQYAAYTIFSDVPSAHWAAKYINAAARDKKIIGGFPDGTFRPEDIITEGQAITIALRIIGYSDADVGPNWPDSYIQKAAALKVTEDIEVEAEAPMTRGKAALLFGKLLETKQNGSEITLLESFGYSFEEDILILAVRSTDSTLKKGEYRALKNGAVAVFKAVDDLSSASVGLTGKIKYNKDKEAMIFTPDQGLRRELAVTTGVKAEGLQCDDELYPIPSKTMIMDKNGDAKQFGDIWYDIRPGSEYIIIYDENNNLVRVMELFEASEIKAYILSSDGGVDNNPLEEHYGQGAANAKIVKNGVSASIGDLKKYDVVYYSEQSGTYIVSDNRLTGKLDGADPNLYNPITLTVYGNELEVARGSEFKFSAFELGEMVTVFMTAGGQVAGAVPETELSERNYAIVSSLSSNSVTAELLFGGTVSGATSIDYTGRIKESLVGITNSIYGDIKLTLFNFDEKGSYGALDIENGRLGTARLSPEFSLYERIAPGSVIKKVDIEKTSVKLVESADILFVKYDSMGMVRFAVTANVFNDAFEFGKIDSEIIWEYAGDGGDAVDTYVKRTRYTLSGAGGKTVTGVDYFDSKLELYEGFGGLAVTLDGAIADFIKLKSAGTGVLSDFYYDEYIRLDGKTCLLSEDTLYYLEATDTYISLVRAKNLGNSFEVLVDDRGEGGKARVIIVR